MAPMVKSTFLMLVANFVHGPSSLWSGVAPAQLDVSSIAGVDATSVVQVGAVVVPRSHLPQHLALVWSVASSLGHYY